MQSHASRHFVSDHLKDLHLLARTGPAAAEEWSRISVAYGRRAVPKLLAILGDAELPAQASLQCLQALDAAIVSQEQKTEAIRHGAAPQIISCIYSESRKVADCACRVLNKLITLMDGRQAAVEHGAVQALVQFLPASPASAARCIGDLSNTLPGAEAMVQSGADVFGALATVLEELHSTPSGCEAKAQVTYALAMLLRSVSAVAPAVAAGVPARVLSHVPEGKHAIREAGVISTLSKLLDSQDDQTVSMALHTFMGLTVDVQSKEPTLQAAGDRLVQILKGRSGLSVELQHVCRAVLLNAAEHPLARQLLDKQLPPDEQAVFLGPLTMLPFDYRHKIQTPGYVA